VNLSHHLLNQLRRALAKLQFPDVPLILEQPPNPELGDRSCTAALALARELKRSPRQIALEILEALPQDDPLIGRVEIAGPGYLNFFWSADAYLAVLRSVLEEKSEFGSSQVGAGERWLFEFVSANPTGPMNIVSARAAAIGDSLVKLSRKIGFAAQSEYYVNDAGRQVELLGLSVRARMLQAKGQSAEIPEGGYQGNYILELAEIAAREFPGNPLEATGRDLGLWTAHRLAGLQKQALIGYGVHFDRWFFESELHESDQPNEVLKRLKEAGHIYVKEGAQFFATSEFGDDEDRVVITSDGRPTYFLPDMAYHLDKAQRGFTKVIDLWGPDHHGHVQRMQAAMKALDQPEGFLEVLIIQQVNLLRGGQPVKMSKRTGEIITMEELLDEVGPDAAKQIFLSRRWSSHLDFDIEVAKDRSEKSPVFYVQYAHARISAIFRKAGAWGPPAVGDLETLGESEERDLLRALSLFPEIVEAAALQMSPHKLNAYLGELSTLFHKFYHERRVLSEDAAVKCGRLALCRAVQIVIKEGLRLLGMDAPEQM
jgi:arginyl-tRNA synthetase